MWWKIQRPIRARANMEIGGQLKEIVYLQYGILNWDSHIVARVKWPLNSESFAWKHFLAEETWFFRDEYLFYRFYVIATRSAHFLSDWLMFKIVERDWLINLRGMVYRFDKTNDYKGMKQNNDGRCLFLITQWKPVLSKLMTTFFRRWTIYFNERVMKR